MQRQTMDSKALYCRRARLLVAAAVAALLTSFLADPFSTPWWWLTVLWVAGFVWMYAAYYPLQRRIFSFAVQNDTVTVTNGVFFKHEQYIEIKNIQFVNFIRTPFQRLWGLRSVVLMAAGGHVYIPCLTVPQVEALMDAIGRGDHEL